ncbi:MAG: arginyltransferase [Phycisphaerae bacterium]|nr:arginyltransferase [Phycisphaerae bacterium]
MDKPYNDSNDSADATHGIRLHLYVGEAQPCAYLPGRAATNEFVYLDGLGSSVYQNLMDLGFRRSGDVAYRPRCDGCVECVPIRVPVNDFKATRSQRRSVRKNRDVRISITRPQASDEKWDMYRSYLAEQHDGTMSDDRESFERFLYRSPIDTIEMTYHIDGDLVGVGILDVTPSCLSSVYFYFDPNHSRRSLGVFSVIMEIEECRRRGLPYWYGGYHVAECQRMAYKADFRPNERLGADSRWHRE